VTDGTALNLGSFQDSGSSWVIPLRSPSVAIDSTAPVSGACLSATDQRGVSRPVSIGCDAGAYEVGPSVVLAYTGPSLVYAGSGSTANVMLSGTTYPAVAGCDLEFEVTRIDPAGGPWTYDATSGTKGTGSAIAYGLTVGTYEVIVRAVGDCAGIPDASGAVVVAPSTIGKGTAGGGSYRVDPFSGRVKFAHVVQVRTVSSKVGRTTVYTTTTKGSLLWTFKNEWRLKASFSYSATDGSSTYGLTTCTTGDFVGGALPPSFTSGRCGRFSGAALLQVYDPIAGEWAASTYTNVRFVATVFDGGTKSVCTKNRCTTTDYTDWFGIRIWADNVPLGPATPLIPTSLLSSLASPNGNGSLRAN
jgi:hypothetical protein